jgi:prephenate dehydrogenase
LVIDVGSVKAPIARAGADLMRQGRFVPCHPVAGTEESGAGAAREGLFTGAKCILTPDDATPGAAVERAQRIWELAGATAARMTPEEHDVAFARVSHLPHLAAYALVDYLQGLPGWRHHAPLAGSGFRDFTRIAGSPAEVWLDIARLNRENLAELLAGAAEAVRQAAGWVRDGRWEELRGLMERARQAKKDMRNQS